MHRFTWMVVGAVMALVIGGLASAAILRGRDIRPDLTTPAGVALAYSLAEQRGDPLAAWNLLATSAQARGDRDRFLARAGTRGTDGTYLSTSDKHTDADTASVELIQTSPGSRGLFGDGGYTSRTTVRLVREGSDWRISVPPDDYLLLDSKS